MTDSQGKQSEVSRTLAHGEVGDTKSVSDTLTGGQAESDPFSTFPVEFGDYTIIDKLGQGGMGVVYRATQKKLNRDVAIKLLPADGLGSATSVGRFQREAESAARLDHPNVVPVYEFGKHDDRWFFSMGLVVGHSLDERVKEAPLPPREAAELIKAVAQAIQYAHEQDVVHRDLKPANILIDGRGEPKVTDFGLAKQVSTDSEFTMAGQVLGTPSYMPPEQAGGDADQVDARSDVYSLGATLYCALTGRPPFQSANLAEAIRLVCEADPVAPRQLNPDVPADLETITLKCLQKEPGKRYQSARELAEDLERWLDGRPIVARPPTRVERLVKWSRRHPARASFAVAVVLGLISTSAGMIWALRERDRANQAAFLAGQEAERADNAAAAAAESAAHAVEKEKQSRAVLDYVVETFLEAGPVNAKGEQTRGIDILKQGERLISQLGDEPEVQAQLKQVIGSLYIEYSEFAAAKPLLEDAVAYRRERASENEIAFANSMVVLADLYQWFDIPQHTEAMKLLDEAIEIYERTIGEGAQIAHARNTRANLLQRGAQDEAAMAEYREALRILLEHEPDDAAGIASIRHGIGIMHFFMSEYDLAEREFEEVIIAETKVLGHDHYDVATTKHVLSLNNIRQGKLETALHWQSQARETREKVLPPEHDHVALSLYTYGNLMRMMRNETEAEELTRRAVEIHEKVYAQEPDHFELRGSKRSFIQALIAAGKIEEAEREIEAMKAAAQNRGDLDEWTTLELMQAEAKFQNGDRAAAMEHLKEAGQSSEYIDPITTWEARARLAIQSIPDGDISDAVAEFDEALAHLKMHPRFSIVNRLQLRTEFADMLWEYGDSEPATERYQRLKDDYLALVRNEDTDAFLVDLAAKYLVSCHADTIRDPQQAVELATRVTASVSRPAPHYRATLALAHHLNGDSAEAIENQELALELLADDSLWRDEYEQRLAEFRARIATDQN